MMGMAGLAVALMVITSLTIATCADGKDFFHHPEIKVRRFLKQLNKPALKSIKSEDGDIIDCVPIAIQPDFDHPSLINHTIQIKPSFIPEGEGDSTYTKKKKKPTQVWHKDGEYCPENTVPIRRTKKEDILRAKSLESFGKKSHQYIPEDTSSNPNFHHEFYGTKASINIWKPDVATPDEFSLSQTWLVSGIGTSRNTIEAGWQVYPGVYGDNNPRLFVYWTGSSHFSTNTKKKKKKICRLTRLN
ncbi:PREDICTED: uncharacterized protein LOC104793364 isoform X2 [Camelina sativa]|uniref:Uncharacterized protein LOC104793364 isoform X2 n=1 Tax=Camelina sativa TaxID=90675 RepID=A0ABM0ZMY2_CAMSA|nr:PREDICTED: uncharacterized protein LOC104793364 isoform X2 [Camelina sativa]